GHRYKSVKAHAGTSVLAYRGSPPYGSVGSDAAVTEYQKSHHELHLYVNRLTWVMLALHDRHAIKNKSHRPIHMAASKQFLIQITALLYVIFTALAEASLSLQLSEYRLKMK